MLNDIYESGGSFLKADDIKGHQPIVTIATAEVVENDYGNGPKKQIVLTFEGKDKKLGLNYTNASKIAELTGTEDFNEWIGVTLKLYVEKVKGPSGMVDGIRIFPELPQGQAKGGNAAVQRTGNRRLRYSVLAMSITEVYGAGAAPKSTHLPILTEDEIRQRMSDIARRVEKERQDLRDAYAALAKREARATLAIAYRQPDLLGKVEAREYLQKAIDENVKLTETGKEALLNLELEDLKSNYDLAKFDCETSDKDYAKLEKQLSFYQSLLKMA
jgi:hypothetical protein